METTKFSVAGMSCEHCVRAVREAIASVPGVESVEVSLANGTATVIHSTPLDDEAVAHAVHEEGYEATRA